MLVCKYGYLEKGRIRCRISGSICAHVRYCQLSCKWRQTDEAKECEMMQDERREKDGKQDA